jgi:ornithine carbamoyltransferase
MRHVLSILDLSAGEIEQIFAVTKDLKAKLVQGVREPLLPGRVLALLFEKPSLRTRVSFETAMLHLGGGSLFLGEDVGWGQRESPADFARVISEYVDVVVCRAKSHQKVKELATHATCPVINGLTDTDHPCQALADVFTLQEIHGPLKGKRVAFVGDANNVARSLADVCARLGIEFVIASPKGYQFDEAYRKRLQIEEPKFTFVQTADPAAAVKGACCVYTDVWASMGQETEQAQRAKAFAPYQVNAALMQQAPKDAVFLHCLPARRGEEVTDDVIDAPRSAVVQQAGNRMHVQKGLLAWLLT